MTPVSYIVIYYWIINVDTLTIKKHFKVAACQSRDNLIYIHVQLGSLQQILYAAHMFYNNQVE